MMPDIHGAWRINWAITLWRWFRLFCVLAYVIGFWVALWVWINPLFWVAMVLSLAYGAYTAWKH